MRYLIYPVYPARSYSITIGSRDKPDSEFRELIREQIDKAMSSFERQRGEAHTVAVIPDWQIGEPGLESLPNLPNNGQYLIFALLYSNPDSAEKLSNQELELYRRDLEEALSGIANKETRAALILLQDCSVSIIASERGAKGGLFL